MKNLRNNVRITGYLNEEPIILNFENGKKAACLNITSATLIKKEGKTIKKENHKGIVINELAEFAENKLSTGTEIIIEGYIKTQKNSADNNIKKITEILVNSIKYRNIKHAIETNKIINK